MEISKINNLNMNDYQLDYSPKYGFSVTYHTAEKSATINNLSKEDAYALITNTIKGKIRYFVGVEKNWYTHPPQNHTKFNISFGPFTEKSVAHAIAVSFQYKVFNELEALEADKKQTLKLIQENT